MERSEYIRSVCAENRLVDVAAFFCTLEDDVYYLDRHVNEPPSPLGVSEGCEAGFALLKQWLDELAAVKDLGLFVSEPLLVIDDPWLNAEENATLPHVYTVLVKHSELLPSSPSKSTEVRPKDSDVGQILGGLEGFSLQRLEGLAHLGLPGMWAVIRSRPNRAAVP